MSRISSVKLSWILCLHNKKARWFFSTVQDSSKVNINCDHNRIQISQSEKKTEKQKRKKNRKANRNRDHNRAFSEIWLETEMHCDHRNQKKSIVIIEKIVITIEFSQIWRCTETHSSACIPGTGRMPSCSDEAFFVSCWDTGILYIFVIYIYINISLRINKLAGDIYIYICVFVYIYRYIYIYMCLYIICFCVLVGCSNIYL